MLHEQCSSGTLYGYRVSPFEQLFSLQINYCSCCFLAFHRIFKCPGRSQLARAEWISLRSVTDCFVEVQLCETVILAIKNPDPSVPCQKTSPFFLTVLAPFGIVKVCGDAFVIIWKLLRKELSVYTPFLHIEIVKEIGVLQG